MSSIAPKHAAVVAQRAARPTPAAAGVDAGRSLLGPEAPDGDDRPRRTGRTGDGARHGHVGRLRDLLDRLAEPGVGLAQVSRPAGAWPSVGLAGRVVA